MPFSEEKDRSHFAGSQLPSSPRNLLLTTKPPYRRLLNAILRADIALPGQFSHHQCRMNVAASKTVRSRLRIAVEVCVGLFLAALAMETWLLAGLVVPCRVVGGSMAENLLGEHHEVTCADCGHRFACGVERYPVAPRAVCPNCGYTANDLQSLPTLHGERLLIDRVAFLLRQPRRWEIVALRHPQRADEILIKRVVGLPGESIEIRNGDIYADGQIQRKNLEKQRDLAILVHDADCRPTMEPIPPPRWRAERRNSRWDSTGGTFSHSVGTESEPIDWLVYHHERRGEAEAVTDVYGYNQSQPRREEDVHAVTDLMVCFQLEPVGNGTCVVRANDGSDAFEVRLQFLGKGPDSWQYGAFHNGELIPGSGGWVKHADRRLVEVSLFDQQLLFALDGQTLVAWPYCRSVPIRPLSPSLPAIGVEGRMKATVDRLRVYRDVYYTNVTGVGTIPSGGLPRQLADREFFVLGDNSPISVDSRIWTNGGGVSANSLIGKPLAAISPLDFTLWWGWRFQVPNLRRIRYIQ